MWLKDNQAVRFRRSDLSLPLSRSLTWQFYADLPPKEGALCYVLCCEDIGVELHGRGDFRVLFEMTGKSRDLRMEF